MTDETSNGAAAAATTDANAVGPQFTVQKIYIKDASFEAPNAPQIFQDEGQPQLQLNLQQKVGRLNAEAFEVVLTITLTCTIADKTAYLAEVQQAGVFGLRGFDPAQLDMMLGTYCPNVLFPYARQSIGDLVQHGGFPPFLLQPLNFEGIYAEQQRRRAEGAEGGDGALTPAIGNA